MSDAGRRLVGSALRLPERSVNIAWGFSWSFLPAVPHYPGFFPFFFFIRHFALARKTLMF
ncbi:MAG: hypothetical protein H6887_00535 [Hoeflea sp.]|nr:hypothetical protein [Hoeflea sp.]